MRRTATANDLIPEPHRVLGTQLRPFCLGHHLLLRRLHSPFVSDPTANAGPEELALAVFLCAAPYADTQATLLAGDWPAVFGRWSRQLRSPWFRRPRFNESKEREKLAAYLRDGYRRAPVWRHGGPGLKLTAPWECLLLARLGQGGMARAEILELYLPAVWYHYHTLQELQRADNHDGKTPFLPTFYNADIDAALHPNDY